MAKTYLVQRSLVIDADLRTLRALVDDLRQWPSWSPWEGLDPDVSRAYSGADHGVGQRYAWNGNRKAGSGWMEVTAIESDHTDVRLRFDKPFPSESDVEFRFTPVAGDGGGAGSPATPGSR